MTARPLAFAAFALLTACSSGGSPVSASGSSATSSPPPTVVASGSSSTSASVPSPSGDGQVEIPKCASEAGGYVTVEGYVRNTTGRRVDALNVVFEIVDPSGTRLDSVFGSVELLAAGQRARFYTNSSTPISGKFTCRLLQVTAG
jgi:hypothetical protein